MHAKELIGELALRTSPVILTIYTMSLYGERRHEKQEDWSYCHGKPVKIVNATDTHVYVEVDGISGKHITALDDRYLMGWVKWEPEPSAEKIAEMVRGQQ